VRWSVFRLRAVRITTTATNHLWSVENTVGFRG
jgi:hypothetical protein